MEGRPGAEPEEQIENLLNEMVDYSSDCEKYEEEVINLESKIKEMEPDFDEDWDNEEVFVLNKFNSLDKVYLGTDLLRSCEGLFRPYLSGKDQQGLVETVCDVLQVLGKEKQKSLLKNVYIMGGGAGIEGLSERLGKDLEDRFVYLKERDENRGTNILESINVRYPFAYGRKEPILGTYKRLVFIIIL